MFHVIFEIYTPLLSAQEVNLDIFPFCAHVGVGNCLQFFRNKKLRHLTSSKWSLSR